MPSRSSWIFGRAEERGPQASWSGFAELASRSEPESKRIVANGSEVAQKAMQIDNGFLRGDANQGVNEGMLTEHIAFRQASVLVLCGSCASPRTCA